MQVIQRRKDKIVEYIFENGYYGNNALYNGNILVLSDDLLLIDVQTGQTINEIIDNIKIKKTLY